MSLWEFFRLPSSRRADTMQSSYVTSLENHIDQLRGDLAYLRNKYDLLLDRVLYLSTGAPLEIPQGPPPLTTEQKQAVRDGIDEMSNDKPFGGHPTFASLLSAVEAQTFHEAAQAQSGYEEVEPGASVVNAKEEESEEARKARLTLRKHAMQAAALAQQEYLENTAPKIG